MKLADPDLESGFSSSLNSGPVCEIVSMSQGRTKVAIIGADASAFHIFNKLYRSDDCFEVSFFLNLDQKDTDSSNRRYPPVLCGPSNERGIPIFAFAPFQHRLVDQAVEKCIFVRDEQRLPFSCCPMSRCGLFGHFTQSAFDADSAAEAACFLLRGHAIQSTRSAASSIAACGATNRPPFSLQQAKFFGRCNLI